MKTFFLVWSTRVLDRQNLAIWFVSSLAGGFAGPFGTFGAMALGERLAFWAAIIGCGLFVASLLMSARDIYFSHWERSRVELVSAVIFTIVFAPILHLILAQYAAPLPSSFTFTETISAVLSISIVIVAVRIVLFATVASEIQESPPIEAPRLMKRLPSNDCGPVLRISGKDHFVEVTTAKGRYDIRMRLADAVAEMDGVEGFLTHRSHWIAVDAIQSVERVKGRHYVVSADMARIPVSRTHLPKLEEAGFA
ncbi:MAG: LytTR family DNA-binding domain-containing protein [Pseudomonadota bacterium]